MASGSLPSADLRRSAVESKRYHDHKAKWAYGARVPKCSRHDSARYPSRLRPALPDTHNRKVSSMDRDNPKVKSGNKNIFRLDATDEVYAFQSDSSSNGSGKDTTVYGDEGVFFSFDAHTSPATAGEHLLSVAINKAVERFEVRETKKIEKEYEFVPMEMEEEEPDGYLADDDFEIVDPTRL